MKLTAIEKTDRMFFQIRDLTGASFTGVEVPPIQILRQQFDLGEVFVRMCNLVGCDNEVASYSILTEKHGEPYIWSIATKESHRGQGLASSLLTEMETFVKERGKFGIGLMTNVNNPAQKLYFDAGYRVRRVFENYYFDNGDGLYMRKDLSC